MPFCAKKRGRRGREKACLIKQVDKTGLAWLIKQVETFEQTGARKVENMYTNSLFNVSHKCYQGPLHLRQHVLQYKNRSVWQKVIYIESIYIHRMPECLAVFKRDS